MTWVFLVALLDMFPLCLLAYVPFYGRLRLPYPALIACLLALCGVQGVCYIWMHADGFPGYHALFMLRCFFLMLHAVVYVASVRALISKLMFLALLLIPYAVMTSGLAQWLRNLLGMEPSCENFVVMRAGVLALAYPLAQWFLQHYFTPAMETYNTGIWRSACRVGLVFTICTLLLTLVPVRTSLRGNVVMAVRMLMAFGSCFSGYQFIRAQRQMDLQEELDSRIRATETLVELQKEQYDEIARTLRSNRTVRHDFRHQISVIRYLAEHGQIKELCEYLDRYDHATPQQAEPTLCENPIASAVVGHYLGRAKELQADIDCELAIAHDIGVRDTDLCVLLGNLLENAVEGCEAVPQPQRFLRVRSRCLGDALYLTVDNSCTGAVQECDGRYISTKEKRRGAKNDNLPSGEGLGLWSVQCVVKRYNGMLKVQHTETEFQVSVMLELETAESELPAEAADTQQLCAAASAVTGITADATAYDSPR